MKRAIIIITGIVLASALLVSAGAQNQRQVSTSLASPTAPPTVTTQDGKMVVTGAEVGIRIDQRDAAGVRGTVVVKIDGKWQEVRLASSPAN